MKPSTDDMIKHINMVMQTNPAWLVGYIKSLEDEVNRVRSSLYLPKRSSMFESRGGSKS